jgi:predicted DNA-binding transcriptional regulator AlpA
MTDTTKRRAPRTTTPHLEFPAGYPDQRRFQDGEFFRAALMGTSRAAFYNYQNAGLLPKPDAKFGHRNAWRETTIAQAVEAFAARARATA